MEPPSSDLNERSGPDSRKSQRADEGRKVVCERAKAEDFGVFARLFTSNDMPKQTGPTMWEVKVSCAIRSERQEVERWRNLLEEATREPGRGSGKVAGGWHPDCKILGFRRVEGGTWVELSHPIILFEGTTFGRDGVKLMDSRSKTFRLSAFKFQWLSRPDDACAAALELWKIWDCTPVLCVADEKGAVAVFEDTHSMIAVRRRSSLAVVCTGNPALARL